MFSLLVLLSIVLFQSYVESRHAVDKVDGDALDLLTSLNMDTDVSATTMYRGYDLIGCYNDDRARALRVHYFNARSYAAGSRVQKCADQAAEKGYKVFGVQYQGECWGDAEGETRYSMYDKSDKCIDGTGGNWVSDVYRIKVLCHAHGNNYTVGENMYIPNEYSDLQHASCRMCTCGPEGATKCYKLHCDLNLGGQSCEKWTAGAPDGQCCPHCQCVHNGAVENEGSKWVVRNKDKCTTCICKKGKGECIERSVLCGATCANPSFVKGECCPICGPTTAPPNGFTIRPDTPGPVLPTPPPLIIPPRPPGFK